MSVSIYRALLLEEDAMYTVFYEGATGEVGDPNDTMNPPAPKQSRAFGEPFVHYITHIEKSEDIIQFWYPQEVPGKILPVDYELLASHIMTPDEKMITLVDKIAADLIIEVFFRSFCENYFEDKVTHFSFSNLKSGSSITLPYPVH